MQIDGSIVHKVDSSDVVNGTVIIHENIKVLGDRVFENICDF
jgi:hypothetical protein